MAVIFCHRLMCISAWWSTRCPITTYLLRTRYQVLSTIEHSAYTLHTVGYSCLQLVFGRWAQSLTLSACSYNESATGQDCCARLAWWCAPVDRKTEWIAIPGRYLVSLCLLHSLSLSTYMYVYIYVYIYILSPFLSSHICVYIIHTYMYLSLYTHICTCI